eukprot:gene13796-6528_t
MPVSPTLSPTALPRYPPKDALKCLTDDPEHPDYKANEGRLLAGNTITWETYRSGSNCTHPPAAEKADVSRHITHMVREVDEERRRKGLPICSGYYIGKGTARDHDGIAYAVPHGRSDHDGIAYAVPHGRSDHDGIAYAVPHGRSDHGAGLEGASWWLADFVAEWALESHSWVPAWIATLACIGQDLGIELHSGVDNPGTVEHVIMQTLRSLYDTLCTEERAAASLLP